MVEHDLKRVAQLVGAEIQQDGLDALLLLRGMQLEAAYSVALQGSKKVSAQQASGAGRQTQSTAIIGCVARVGIAPSCATPRIEKH